MMASKNYTSSPTLTWKNDFGFDPSTPEVSAVLELPVLELSP